MVPVEETTAVAGTVEELGGREDAQDTVDGRADPFCEATAAEAADAAFVAALLAFTVAALSDSIFCSSVEIEMALGAGVDFQGLLAPEERITSLSMFVAEESSISVGML